ncbi:protein AATF/BFR2 [Trypanosoma grayi]|uniref:protein AATF/BFR2 n=1 Tax=Trypanosoma grayi TaxID=71804 RepID=UPI0004F47897|nr:protein AATF/BFR2 [Trypanosoma grayi]KEG09283.1 protein AATF/BFR2 [Trypanosoma grayi]
MSARRGTPALMSSSTARKRKKSMSEIVNEQFAESDARSREGDVWDDVGGEAPQIDDYYNDDDDYDVPAPASKRSRTEQQQQPKRLRRRGPLDASLSAGEYAATPVDVEAAMDGIFGALEMNDDDDDYADEDLAALHEDDSDGYGDEDDDDDEDGEEEEAAERKSKQKRKRASGRPETEEEYVAWLEAQQEKKQARRRAAGGDGESGILEQLESLRKAQMELGVKEAQEGSDAADDPRVKQRQRAQAAVRHYVMLYSQLLRVRIKLQPAVARAVAFPQYYALEDFLQEENAQAKADVEEVASNLRELLGTFHALSTDGKQQQQQNATSLDFSDINACHRRMMKGVDTCIEYWGAKLVQPNSAKLRTLSQPLLQQIRAILESKARLRSKVQKNRSHVAILGHPEHYKASQSAEGKAARALHIAEGDIDEEIYDDAEFLREVVRRGGVAKLEQQLQEIQSSLQPHEALAKRGFHRLTKGKAVNYEPRPKLVGFLLPLPYAVSGQHEVMVKSLFQ